MIICVHYQKRWNYIVNNITLSKNQFYKHYQIRKGSTFLLLFCSVLFFLLFILLRVYVCCVYFRVVVSQQYLTHRYQGVMISDNVKMSRTFLINFSATVTSKLLYDLIFKQFYCVGFADFFTICTEYETMA